MSTDDATSIAVDRLVKTAKEAGSVLRTAESARRLLAEHPHLGITVQHAAQLIALCAVAAGVPIQFTSLDKK